MALELNPDGTIDLSKATRVEGLAALGAILFITAAAQRNLAVRLTWDENNFVLEVGPWVFHGPTVIAACSEGAKFALESAEWLANPKR